jgi:hypothetical protein
MSYGRDRQTATCANGQLSILRPYRSNISSWHARAATRTGYWASRSEGQLLSKRAYPLQNLNLACTDILTSQQTYLSCTTRPSCIHICECIYTYSFILKLVCFFVFSYIPKPPSTRSGFDPMTALPDVFHRWNFKFQVLEFVLNWSFVSVWRFQLKFGMQYEDLEANPTNVGSVSTWLPLSDIYATATW